jgi:hypothetical protein
MESCNQPKAAIHTAQFCAGEMSHLWCMRALTEFAEEAGRFWKLLEDLCLQGHFSADAVRFVRFALCVFQESRKYSAKFWGDLKINKGGVGVVAVSAHPCLEASLYLFCAGSSE